MGIESSLPGTVERLERTESQSQFISGYYAYEENAFLKAQFTKCLIRYRQLGEDITVFSGLRHYLEIIINGGRIWDQSVQVRQVIGYAAQVRQEIVRLERGEYVAGAPLIKAEHGVVG